MDTYDSHFDRDLIMPNGMLARLHKGGSPKAPPPVPPPVRETAEQVQEQGNKERKKAVKRQGTNSTLLGSNNRQPDASTATGTRSLLG